MAGSDYRERLGAKLVPLETAIGRVESGDVVAASPFSCTPYTLCRALAERAGRGEIQDIRVDHPASLFPWTDPRWAGAIHLVDNYATAANRDACLAGQTGYLPVGRWMEYQVPPGWSPAPDVYLVPVSPPDALGFCSYGPGVWFSGTLVRNAKTVIAEIQPHFIRTGGENHVHVDEIDFFVEAQEETGVIPGEPMPGPRASVGNRCPQPRSHRDRGRATVDGIARIRGRYDPGLIRRGGQGYYCPLVTVRGLRVSSVWWTSKD